MTLNVRLLAAFTLISININAAASPTTSEFQQCKTLAVKHLDSCLSASTLNNLDSGNKPNDCWQQSKASFLQCKSKVLKSHTVDNKKVEAAVKAQMNK